MPSFEVKLGMFMMQVHNETAFYVLIILRAPGRYAQERKVVTPAYTQRAQPEQKWRRSQWGRGLQGILGFETWHVSG